MKNLFYWLLVLLFPYLIIYLALGDTIYLFLKAGYIGLPYCFPYIFKTGILQGVLFLIFFLGLIVVLFAKGLNLRKKILGKVSVSTSLFLWFLLGFICLGIHMWIYWNDWLNWKLESICFELYLGLLTTKPEFYSNLNVSWKM